MKKILFVLFVVLLIALPYKQVELFAPELFAYGRGYGIQTNSNEVYVIYSEWEDNKFLFLMYGNKEGNFWEGKIVQILGDKIESYAPYICSDANTYCYKRQDKTNWRGWIEFRGHNRPFCGGEKIKMPCIKFGG